MQLNQLINSNKKEFEIFYKKLLTKNLSKNLLSKAMIYGSMNGGKRIRPFLVSVFCKMSIKLKKPIFTVICCHRINTLLFINS